MDRKLVFSSSNSNKRAHFRSDSIKVDDASHYADYSIEIRRRWSPSDIYLWSDRVIRVKFSSSMGKGDFRDTLESEFARSIDTLYSLLSRIESCEFRHNRSSGGSGYTIEGMGKKIICVNCHRISWTGEKVKNMDDVVATGGKDAWILLLKILQVIEAINSLSINSASKRPQ